MLGGGNSVPRNVVLGSTAVVLLPLFMSQQSPGCYIRVGASVTVIDVSSLFRPLWKKVPEKWLTDLSGAGLVCVARSVAKDRLSRSPFPPCPRLFS